MSKTLKRINLLAKIGKIISYLILAICALAGVIFLAVLISLFMGGDGSIIINGLKLVNAELNIEPYSIGTAYGLCILGILSFFGESYVCISAIRYFKHELKVGTPFTFEGAHEFFLLGLKEILVPLIAQIISAIAYQLLNKLQMGAGTFTIKLSLGMGIALLIVSLLMKYGAEVKEEH